MSQQHRHSLRQRHRSHHSQVFGNRSGDQIDGDHAWTVVILQCGSSYNSVLGILVTKRKEEIQSEIEKQQSLGPQDLQEEDQHLAEVNLEDLEDSSGERQEYWLIAIQAARKAGQLAQELANKESMDSKDVEVDNENGH